ncbi:MAG: hypothetical protein IAE82_21205 [Opitutaceae bacterium]|nr:hypothetical protein [Opitutaceae bacterium]
MHAWKIYLPVNLDLERLALDSSEPTWARPLRLEKLEALVSFLVTQGWRRDIGADDDAIPLHSKTLEALLGSRYSSDALRLLTRWGVIERSAIRYKPGERCDSYRLREPYASALPVAKEIAGSRLPGRLRKLRERQTRECVGSDPVRLHYRDTLGRVALAPVPTSVYPSDPKARVVWAHHVESLQSGERWISASANTGRVFHDVVVMPRELRAFLSIDRESVDEVDKANAQPFLMLAYYPPGEPERKQFCDVVCRGHFYPMLRHVAEHYGFEPRASSWDDDTLKRKVAAALFDRNRDEPSPMRKALRHLFPYLADELTLRRAGDHRRLARDLQSRESELFQRRIAPRIIRELPDCPFLTIHDGILCKARFAPQVRRFVEEETVKVYGVRPLVRLKSEKAQSVPKAA